MRGPDAVETALDLDVSTETIGRILRLHVDEGVEAAVVADRAGVESTTVERFAE